VTTQNSHPESSDVNASVVEHSSVSETTVETDETQTAPPGEETTQADSSSVQEPTPVAEQADTLSADLVIPFEAQVELSSSEPAFSPESAAQTEISITEMPSSSEVAESHAPAALPIASEPASNPTPEEDTQSRVSAPQGETEPATTEQSRAEKLEMPFSQTTSEATDEKAEETGSFSYTEVISLVKTNQEEVRPFTAFIEEFRQAEARLNTPLQMPTSEALSDLFKPAETDPVAFEQHPISQTSETATAKEEKETAATTQEAAPSQNVDNPSQAAVAPLEENQKASPSPQASQEETTTKKPAKEETATPVQPPTERAVSPLLRPATRVRVPRHSSRHQREELAAAPMPVQIQPTQPIATTESQTPATPVEPPMPAPEPAEPPRPARRYRFDRPSTTNGTTGMTGSLPAVPAQSTGSQQRIEDIRDKDNQNRSSNTGSFTRLDSVQNTNDQPTEPQTRITSSMLNVTNGNHSAEQQTQKQPLAQETATESTPPVAENGRRRGQDKQKEAAIPHIPEPIAPVEMIIPSEEIAPEDLPPLEYSELQKASSSRRRRRHRSSATNNTAAAATPAPEPPAPPMTLPTPAVSPVRPIVNPPVAASSYNIVSGYTISQMNQGNELTGPFMGPEPSPARGSVLGRDGKAITRSEAQRVAPAYPPARSTETAPSSTSLSHFANSVVQAIQMQTDRMVAEMRRTSQAPASVSVTLPPFPSTERVGVFVDVANLLYSARTLRISIDFGKLLDFLRGNRRLVRAHAYCPTSPQPGDEQMFLQAVKGLGYRITTKNYKTFSSGAKKADLDLDLCMDVVRLVEGKAVDCIVLVSGDSDFMPMLDYCSDHGVRVEVAAFDEAMSATLRQSCDLFINLSMLEEIRS
jgi:uncharacterized LabA/DUF88 family protein